MISKLLYKFRSAYLHGKAFKMIEKGNFHGGAKVLEKLCKDSRETTSEYIYFRIGDCYRRIGNFETALKWLKMSFEIYQRNSRANKDENYLSCYWYSKEAYIDTLKKLGKYEIAKIIHKKSIKAG